MMRLDRFKEPTARDDLQACVWCYTLVHYETLTKGYCEDCCVLPEDDEKEEDENES